MAGDRRGVSPVALVLMLFLLVAILAVGTFLAGRLLGWWTYADLPLIGQLFPAPAESDPTDDPADETPVESPNAVDELMAQLARREERSPP